MDFVLHLPVVLTIPSSLTFFGADESIWTFLDEMVNAPLELEEKDREVQQMGKKMHRILRMEGIEDVMEEKLQNDQDEYLGAWIVTYSIVWNNLQDSLCHSPSIVASLSFSAATLTLLVSGRQCVDPSVVAIGGKDDSEGSEDIIAQLMEIEALIVVLCSSFLLGVRFVEQTTILSVSTQTVPMLCPNPTHLSPLPHSPRPPRVHPLRDPADFSHHPHSHDILPTPASPSTHRHAPPFHVFLSSFEKTCSHHFINTLNPQSISFTEAADIHTYLMTSIASSIWLPTPCGLRQLEIQDDDEQQSVHETILKQVLSPSEKYIYHLCVNRYSIIEGEQSMNFLTLLAQLLRISPYNQPTMEFVLNMRVCLMIPSCLTFFEKNNTIYWVLYLMNDACKEWNITRGELQKMVKKVHRMLRMEGVEDVIEEKIRIDQDEYFGELTLAESIELNRILGKNIPLEE
ncbi:hypothetical protein BLNAU_25013 [Blattamonas nauphoetae]|uniref:Uncharacterized protein n=1 Tax=Blattamonas nauphoetae TaxID=2049346 RepID=A0ABQ9WKT7_9EUKA|nr:hypothetical protein BLNAU_25013 [Blattamonas nauphoetae]